MRRPPGLTRRIARLRRLDGGQPTMAAAVESLAEASAPTALMLMGLIAMVPVPGVPVGMVFGTVASILAIQTLVFGQAFRLPDRLARLRIPAPVVAALARLAVLHLRRLERRLRVRAAWAVQGAGAAAAGVMIAFQAVLIALPIPFGNTLPAVALVVLAIGLSARDGLVVLIGHGLALAGLAVAVGLSWGMVAVVQALFG